MVVIAEPLQSWRRRREAGPLQPTMVSPGASWGLSSDAGHWGHAREGWGLRQLA